MNLYCINHNFLYETEKLLFLFLPNEKNTVLKEFTEDSGNYFYTEIQYSAECVYFKVRFSFKGEKVKDEKTVSRNLCKDEEYELLALAYPLLKKLCGNSSSWGMLTGVRPAKLMLNKIEDLGEAGAIDCFNNRFFVSPEKTALALEVAKTEMPVIRNSSENSFSLYISIPFCPTRCSYCSFVSHSIGTNSAKKLVPEYVEKLCEEIKITAEKAKQAELKLTTVYWGGGTPTTLTAAQLDTVLTAIEKNFDLSLCEEYTVEAGRPDTITKDKLTILKKHGVNRISINPQTFNDSVLKEIGRQHTTALTVEMYQLAREIGFKVINMDLIAGLPTDTFESFKNSVDRAIALGAENITVHTLCLKRSSTLVTEDETDSVTKDNIEAMLRYSQKVLKNAGYKPYYMYRQAKALGNFENIGWCKDNTECKYNILMMEEYQHILSVGAGAVTKLLSPGIERIERIFNYKFPFEYISRFDGIKDKKSKITDFFREG